MNPKSLEPAEEEEEELPVPVSESDVGDTSLPGPIWGPAEELPLGLRLTERDLVVTPEEEDEGEEEREVEVDFGGIALCWLITC